MSYKDDGGPAFPSHGSMGEVVQDGMSLRDYFAAAALQGRLADGCNRDGDGSHFEAAIAYQLRDGEPDKSGRHCPLDTNEEDV